MVVIHTMTPSVSMALPPVATVGGLDAELPCLGHGFAHADEGVPVAMQPNLPARCDLSLEQFGPGLPVLNCSKLH